MSRGRGWELECRPPPCVHGVNGGDGGHSRQPEGRTQPAPQGEVQGEPVCVAQATSTPQQDIKVSRPVMWAPGFCLSPVHSGFPRSPPGGPGPGKARGATWTVSSHVSSSPTSSCHRGPPCLSPGRVLWARVCCQPRPRSLSCASSWPQILTGSRVPMVNDTESQPVTAATIDQAPPEPQAWPCPPSSLQSTCPHDTHFVPPVAWGCGEAHGGDMRAWSHSRRGAVRPHVLSLLWPLPTLLLSLLPSLH